MIPQVATSPEKLPLLVLPDDVLLPGSTIRVEVCTVKNINLVRSCMPLRISVVGVITKEPNKVTIRCMLSKCHAVFVDSLEHNLVLTTETNVNRLHGIGTAGVLIQLPCTSSSRPMYTVLVTGLCRFKLVSIIQEHPYLVGSVVQLDDIRSLDSKNEAQLTELVVEFQKAAQRWLELLDDSVPAVAMLKVSLEQLPIQKVSLFQELLKQVPIEMLADMFASFLRTTTLQERLEVLDAIDLSKRFRITLSLLLRRIQRLEEDQKTSGEEINNNNPESVEITHDGRNLSPDIKCFEDSVDDIAELEIKIMKAKMPEHALKVAVKELGQLKQMAQHVPEYSILRNYLDLVVDLPWSVSVKETCNISKARADLDADHFGFEKVKRGILKYLAIQQLQGSLKTRLLCIVGSPGVCKTSIVKSIAKTLGRPYHLISLSGVSDQHYIRGQRRINIDAMPGRIIQGLRTVKVNNPVMLLDGIDKLGTGIHGDPGAALLEVLDPEQNSSFTDTYLNLPFDLSQVLFVATANNLDDVPTALLNLMMVVNIPDYTLAEKVMLASQQLIPKQLEEHGLSADILDIPLNIIADIVTNYTDEAGVTTLEHEIRTVCRAVWVAIISNDSDAEKDSDVMEDEMDDERLENTELPSKQEKNIQDDNEEHSQHLEPVPTRPLLNLTQLREHMELPVTVDSKMIQDILGPPIFQSGLYGHRIIPGVAVGLACSPNNECVCVIKASCSTGEASRLTEMFRLTLPGQLGSVIQESVKIAMSWIRQHLTWLGIDEDNLKDEFHLDIPDIAKRKDGPSAGITILTALVSLFTNRCVRSDVAMTGEITLKGVVLPVEGIEEKIFGAYRAGITTVILPAANESDLADIPTSVLDEVEMVLVYSVEQVLAAAF